MPNVFISHSTLDNDIAIKIAGQLKQNGVTAWIDDETIQAGDGIGTDISEGIDKCTHFFLLWSTHAQFSEMVKMEWNAALNRKKTIIVGILDNIKVPAILSGLRYLDFRNFDKAFRELLEALQETCTDNFKVIIESVHTGEVQHLTILRKANVRYLAIEAQKAFDLKTELDTGSISSFPIRWILVDVRAKQVWKDLPESERDRLYALVYSEAGPKFCYSELDKLEDIGVYNGIVFHAHFIQHATILEGLRYVHGDSNMRSLPSGSLIGTHKIDNMLAGLVRSQTGLNELGREPNLGEPIRLTIRLVDKDNNPVEGIGVDIYIPHQDKIEQNTFFPFSFVRGSKTNFNGEAIFEKILGRQTVRVSITTHKVYRDRWWEPDYGFSYSNTGDTSVKMKRLGEFYIGDKDCDVTFSI